MHPLDQQMYAADAKASYVVGQLEGEKIWLLSGWLVQTPPVEDWGNPTRRYVYEGGTWTWIAKNRPCL